MDFLSKIKGHLGKRSNREFKKQVQEEKKQKYLFSEDLTDKYRSSRAGFIMRKKRAIAPYTNMFWEHVWVMRERFRESRILAYIGITLIALSGYIVLLSPYFRVSPSHVLLEASNEWVDVSVAYRAIEDIYWQSIFLLDEEAVALTLKDSLKNISHISIDKLYPSGLKVLMTGSPIVYETRITGFERTWRMSENGVLIPKTTQSWGTGTELKQMEIISESLKGEVFFDYKQVISDEKMLLITRIMEIFSLEWPDAKVSKLRYFARENELHLTLTSGTTILLTLEADGNIWDYNKKIENIKNQLIWIRTYVGKYNQALTDGSNAYIDARVVKKLFTCRDQETCKNNLIRVYGDTYRPQ